eukprot:Platyproteum_vivax@DN4850_c0_g1_i1.p1
MDGEQVQLLVGLYKPFKVLLLDEITTDLDVVARQDLLKFLHEESTLRQVTIIYATHILDCMHSWASHVLFLEQGRVSKFGELQQYMSEFETAKTAINEPGIVPLISHWIRSAIEERKQKISKNV